MKVFSQTHATNESLLIMSSKILNLYVACQESGGDFLRRVPYRKSPLERNCNKMEVSLFSETF